ncbi:MAG: hypothetical protein P8Y50_06050 [Sulfurovaceae bacterium]
MIKTSARGSAPTSTCAPTALRRRSALARAFRRRFHTTCCGTKAVPLKGSCIFLHIKSIPTMGCTAMSEEAMLELLKWLDPAKAPILIQAPKGEIVDLLQQAGITLSL